MSRNKLNAHLSMSLKWGVAMLPMAIAFAQMPASAQPKTQAQLKAEAAAAGASKCRLNPTFAADPRLKESPAHRLADEPNAALVAAVMRSEGGCPKPVVLRENIGNQPDRLAPKISGSARSYAIPRKPGQ